MLQGAPLIIGMERTFGMDLQIQYGVIPSV